MILWGIIFFSSMGLAEVIDMDTLYRVYDDGKTRVESPKVDVTTKFLEDRARFRVGYASDIVSSASSDVVSFASSNAKVNGIKDTRKEYSGTFSLEVEDGTLGWSYINSQENDYSSNIVAFAGTREFFEKNTTLFMSFAYGEDSIGATGDPSSFQPMYHETYSLGVTQIFDKISVAQLLMDFRVENGYLSSPYRKARLIVPADGSITAETENHPRTRNRNSLALKYNHHFEGIDTSLASTLRSYLDSWGVNSWTIEERVTKAFNSHFDLAVNLRYYTQKEAKFYQDKYTELGYFYTGNKTLSRYDSVLIGARPTWRFNDQFSLFGKIEQYSIDYKNHTDVGNIADPNDDKALKIQATIYGLGFEGKF